MKKIILFLMLPFFLLSCQEAEIIIDEEDIVKETISLSVDADGNSIELQVSSSAINKMENIVIHWGTETHKLTNKIELNTNTNYTLTGLPEDDYYFRVTADYYDSTYNQDFSIESEIVSCSVSNLASTTDFAITAETYFNCITISAIGKNINKIKDIVISYGTEENNLANVVELESGVVEHTIFELESGTYYFQAKAKQYETGYDGKEYSFEVSSDIINRELSEPEVELKVNEFSNARYQLNLYGNANIPQGKLLWGNSKTAITKKVDSSINQKNYSTTSFETEIYIYKAGTYYFQLSDCYYEYKGKKILFDSNICECVVASDFELELMQKEELKTSNFAMLYCDSDYEAELYYGTKRNNLNKKLGKEIDDANNDYWAVSYMPGGTVYYQLKSVAKTNLNGLKYLTSDITSISFSSVQSQPEAIDLGLSVLWADRDLGAENYWEHGINTVWGDVTGISSSSQECVGKYPPENISGTEYDIATAVLGNGWRLPTKEEIEELKEKCTRVRTTIRGNIGMKLVSKNGNSIFMPTEISGKTNDEKFYWSGTLKLSSNSSAYYFDLHYNDSYTEYLLISYNSIDYRYFIRPVKNNPNWNGGNDSGDDNGNSGSGTGDNNSEEISYTVIDNVSDATGYINSHAYVDLGLSVKWATCNVGASSPKAKGKYYAWGETTTKSSYSFANSKTEGKYMTDISGDSNYDAARANWGSSWRMPTKTEFEELVNSCDWVYAIFDGIYGVKITSKINGNSIFFPNADAKEDSSFRGFDLWYWSSTPDPEEGAYFNSGPYEMIWDYRIYGGSVRPVSD